MTRTWQFTDMEFLVLWESVQNDFLPIPLSYVAPRTEDQLDHAKHRAGERLFADPDHEFQEVLETLADPDLKVTVRALDEREPDNPEHSVRLYGARKGDRGFVVRQLPGETIWHSAGFVITECEAIALANAVVRELPEAPAAGFADLVLTATNGARNGDDYEYVQSAVFDTFDDTVDRKSARFLALPFSTIGLIQIVQGHSRFGPRGVLRRQLELRDLIDDGRCVINFDHPRIARGVDSDRLVDLINAEIAEVVRAIKDERV
ncbi:ESX secretion-associated protein EspG [Nocardia sp. NPDC003482]